MSIQRSGPTPQFLSYVTDYALIPQGGPASPTLLGIVTHNFHWVDVPHYQRGISWDVSTLRELLESHSALLGNVILGQFPAPPGRFPHLNPSVAHYAVLVDGLQRFSIGTILLNVLHNLVLQNSPQYPGQAAYFFPLAARSAPLAAIYQHNDQQLANHPRRAVADGYKTLREEVRKDVERQFASGQGSQLASGIVNLFMNKQIAIDLYFNFATPLELTYTFLGINTIRVELSVVDLLRSSIVEKALSSGWNSGEIEDMENRFTSIFIANERPRGELLPFAGIVWDNLKGGSTASHVFPSWNTSLKQQDVECLLDFVERFLEVDNNGFLTEIRECGAIPFAGALAYYFGRCLQTGVKPDFFDNKVGDDQDLHRFLCANYRVLIDGQIGRTRLIAEHLFDGRISNLAEAADKLSQGFVATPLAAPVDSDWLKSNLRTIDRNRARRIFNAMRLPEKVKGWGASFTPDRYGNAAMHYHIDHLIPAKTIVLNKPGASEAETLVNFAPLVSAQNRIAKATKCSSKLQASDIYGNYVSSTTHAHPYCHWLVANQSKFASQLDLLELLQPNSKPNIACERIDFMSASLLSRI